MSRYSNLLVETLRPLWQRKSSEHSEKSHLQRFWSISFKLTLSALALWFIYYRLNTPEQSLSLDLLNSRGFSSGQWIALAVAALFLSLLNWGSEMIKWHLLISEVFYTPFSTSVKAVITGTTTGIFTPNRIGEFLGRVLALEPQHRIGGALLSFVNGISQTIATFSFGIIGFVFLIYAKGDAFLGSIGSAVLQIVLILFWLVIMGLYFRLSDSSSWLQTSTWFSGRFAKHAHALKGVSAQLLQQLYLLSVFRFVTFIGQYFLVFYLLSPSPNWLSVGGASMLTLFSTTILSFIPVPDLLLRQLIAMSYFDLFQIDLLLVAQAILLVWIINVAMPAVVGSVILLSYRVYRKRK